MTIVDGGYSGFVASICALIGNPVIFVIDLLLCYSVKCLIVKSTYLTSRDRDFQYLILTKLSNDTLAKASLGTPTFLSNGQITKTSIREFFLCVSLYTCIFWILPVKFYNLNKIFCLTFLGPSKVLTIFKQKIMIRIFKDCQYCDQQENFR